MLQQNPTPKQEKKNATNGIFEKKRWETHFFMLGYILGGNLDVLAITMF